LAFSFCVSAILQRLIRLTLIQIRPRRRYWLVARVRGACHDPSSGQVALGPVKEGAA